ncbi:MAG: hypothetical protein DRP08_07190 [Candidatus Aenigmatarchaeota archaeon]|nr:MAG: hypothetical protein DRP08_07190 [Candidatus Aenigmarchaeota archaeon]
MKALEQEGAIEFLLYLYRKEKAKVSEALHDLEVGQSAFYTTLRKLMNAGLIIETRGERFPFPRFFTLSDKGRRVAEHLAEIEKILRE